jgi:hypothetical protein
MTEPLKSPLPRIVGDWRNGAETIAGEDLEAGVKAAVAKLRPPAPKPDATPAERLEILNADLRRWQMAMNVVLDAERQRGNQHVSICGANSMLDIKRALDAVAANDEPLMLEPYAASVLGNGFKPLSERKD